MPTGNESVRDIIEKYAPSLDTRALPEHNAKALASELVDAAYRENSRGENHLAIGALTQAVRALATMRPNPASHEEDYSARWDALADLLRKNRATHLKAVNDYHYAAANQVSANVLATVLTAMGEPIDETMDRVSCVPGLFQDGDTGRAVAAGSVD